MWGHYSYGEGRIRGGYEGRGLEGIEGWHNRGGGVGRYHAAVGMTLKALKNAFRGQHTLPT